MIEAAFKAFARALRAAVAIDPTETGVPSTKGTLTLTQRSASSTTGWATAAASRRRSSASARACALTADHDALRAADGLVVPGVGAFAAAMRAHARARPRRARASSARGRATPVLGLCLGMQLLFDASTELGGDRGLGLLPGRVVALRAPAS